MNKQLLELIRVKFQKKLSEKTGWGRNDVMAAYDAVVTECLIELMDQPQTN